MVFNATFNISSGISCRSVLLVEEIVAADDYYIVSNTPRLSGIWTYKVGMTEAAIRKHAPTPLPNGWDSDSQACPPIPICQFTILYKI